jgi:uncharacterized protein (TIGR02246 family)
MASDEQQIRDLIATWMSATRAGDIATVLSLMTEDVVFLVPGAQPFGKEKFAAAMRPAAQAVPMPKFDGHSEIQEIRVVGDWAFTWTRLTVEVTPAGGGPRNAPATRSRCCRRWTAGGCWRATRICSRRSRTD